MRLKSRLQLWVTVNMWWDSLASSCKYSFPYLLAKVTLFNFFLWSVPYLYVIQGAFRLEHNLLFVIYVWQNKHVSRIYECFVPINIRTIILYPTQNSLNYLRPNVYWLSCSVRSLVNTCSVSPFCSFFPWPLMLHFFKCKKKKNANNWLLLQAVFILSL